jgi:orotidine-5'-phosphate decarboxylase
MKPEERIIVALDVPGADEAAAWAKRLAGRVGAFKIGLQLFTAAGPVVVSRIAAEGAGVFLDLKLHDIPNTVAAAVREAAGLGASLLTIHASGGVAMMRAAAEAAASPAPRRPKILAVTVLTSLGAEDLARAGIVRSPEHQVLALAEDAWLAGCDGVVASPREAAALRGKLGAGPLVVTPGIRGPEDAAGDQRRTATAREAVDAGADYLVIGRPILAAPDPVAALERILSTLR